MKLSLESLIILLIVAGLVGVIAQRLAGSFRGGLLVSIALGFIGALIGSWAYSQFRLPEIFILQFGRTTFPIVWAIIGAAVFVAFLGALTRRNYV